MLYDLRTYRVQPGTMARQLALYAENGYEVQCRHLGNPLFYGVVETGDVNAYVHLWQYENAAEREAHRAALYADADWLRYREMGAEKGWQTEQKNTLLKPAPFWIPQT